MKKGTRAVFDLEIGELTNNQVRVSFKLTLFLFDAAAAAAFWVWNRLWTTAGNIV